MNRRLKRAVFGAASCAAAAFLTTLLVNPSDQSAGAQIVVPQALESESDMPKPPPSSVSIPLPSPPIGPSGSTPTSSTSERRQPLVTTHRTSASTTVPKPAAVDFQAEQARFHGGRVAWNHNGFTGSGFFDYDNASGGSIEWTVTAATTGNTDIVFRFANGSAQARLVAITVNGTLVEYAFFPATNGWSDWRTLTIRTNVPAGTNSIRATAITEQGGPNVDKITLLPQA